jgi:hypothetical protein
MAAVKSAMLNDESPASGRSEPEGRPDDDDLDDDDPDATPIEDINVQWWPEEITGGES